MNMNEAKQIRIEEYLHSLGYSPVRQQGGSLWYNSPFRDEQEPSFKVNTERNLWYDFGAGKGGNIIALAQELYASDSLPYLLERIKEQAQNVRPASFSFGKQPLSKPSFRQLEVVPLSSPALYAYLRQRGINTELAKRECREVRYLTGETPYYAIGFPNRSGRIRDTQQAFQGMHSTEGHHPYTAIGAEGGMLHLRGIHGLPLFPHPAAGKVSRPSRT